MFESACYVTTGTIKLGQYCVSFANPCFNLLVLSGTNECHSKVLEFLDLLKGIAACLECTLIH